MFPSRCLLYGERRKKNVGGGRGVFEDVYTILLTRTALEMNARYIVRN